MKAQKIALVAVLSLTLGGAALAENSPRRNDKDGARSQVTWRSQSSDRDGDRAYGQSRDRDQDGRGGDRDDQRGSWNSPYTYGNSGYGVYNRGVYNNSGRDGYGGQSRRNNRDRDRDRNDAQNSYRIPQSRNRVDRDRR